MLPRTLEPEVMDTHEDAGTYDEMDHSGVNEQFVADLISCLESPAGAWLTKQLVAAAGTAVPNLSLDMPSELEVLDLGTGTARIPIELCRRHDGVRVLAVDASISMLEVARLNLELAGMIDRIMLDHVDAKQLDFPDARFAVVISNSLVHHLAEPKACLADAVRVTQPGGLLFFRDLFRPSTEAEVQQLVQTYVGEESDHAQQLFRDSLHAALTVDEIRAMVAELGCSPDCVQATSDRHWTWAEWIPQPTSDASTTVS